MYGYMAILSLDKLIVFPVFCVLAGVEDRKHNWTWSRLQTGLAINVVVLYVLLYSTLPAQAEKLHKRYWASHRLVDGSQIGGINSSEISPEIAWWALAINTWRLVGYLGQKARLPPWTLAVVAVIVHFASGAGALPCPFVRMGGCGIGEGKIRWLPPLKSPAGLSDFWLFYAATPLLLPRRFPLELPLTARIERRASRSWPARLVPYAPRVFWVSLAFLCFQFGSLLSITREWAWSFFRLYADGTQGPQANPSPLSRILQKPYSWYPMGEAAPGDPYKFTLTAELLGLDVFGVIYCVVMVVAIAAIVPRVQTPGLTTAGAGALAVYVGQGFLVPFVAPPAQRVVAQLFHAPNPAANFAVVMWVVFGCCFAYTVACASAVARLIASCGGRRWKWRVALIVGLALTAELHGRMTKPAAPPPEGEGEGKGEGEAIGTPPPPVPLSDATLWPASGKVGSGSAKCTARMRTPPHACRECLRESGGTCASCAARFDCTCDCVGAGKPPIQVAIFGGSVSAHANQAHGYDAVLSRMHNVRVRNYATPSTSSALGSFCVDEFLPAGPKLDYIIIEYAPDDTVGWPAGRLRPSKGAPGRERPPTQVPNAESLGPLASMERLLRQLAESRPEARPILLYVCGPGNRYSANEMHRCEGRYTQVAQKYGVLEISLRDAFNSPARCLPRAAPTNPPSASVGCPRLLSVEVEAALSPLLASSARHASPAPGRAQPLRSRRPPSHVSVRALALAQVSFSLSGLDEWLGARRLRLCRNCHPPVGGFRAGRAQDSAAAAAAFVCRSGVG